MTNRLSRLDADELFHLALNTAKQGDHGAAIDYLKRTLELTPENAKAQYFLAAEHAQIGMFDMAVAEMEKAVQIDPSLYTAHFQLGLLHLTSGRRVEASAAWQALNPLGDNNPLFLFKQGLESMAADNFDACRDYLNKGIALNTENPELNADMRRLLDSLPEQGSEAKPEEQNNHIFLSAYSSENHSN